MSEFIGESTITVRADTRPYLFGVKKAIEAAEKRQTQIVVKADTRLFRAQAKQAATDVNRFVKASLVVTADTRAFLFQVKRAASEAEKIPFSVTVTATPSMAGFQKSLREKVKSSSLNVVARITVVPDFTGFREKLVAGVKTSSAGVTVPVAVTPVAARGAAAAPAAAPRPVAPPVTAVAPVVAASKETEIAAAKETAAEIDKIKEKSRTENVTKDIAATKLTQRELSRIQREALAENRRRDLARLRGGLPEDEFSALRGAAIKEDQVRTKVKRELADSLRSQELAEKRVQDVVKKSIPIAQIANTLSAAERAALAGVKRAQDALTTATTLGNEKVIQSAKDRLSSAQQIATATAASVTDIRKVVQAEKLLQESAQLAAQSEKEFVGARDAADAANKRNAISQRALQKAREADAVVSTVVNKQLREEIGLRTAVAQATAEQAAIETASAARRVAANKSVRESILANTLSLLGLRGSALAANAAFLGTSAAIITTALAVKSTAELESQFNLFAVTAGATADEMDRVRATAVQLGRDITLPGVGASDATTALVELSKAGLSVQDSIDGARGVLQLATAAAIDNAEATELAASALNAFGLAGNQAVRVADVLANSANQSQGSIVDVGTALQQSAAVARQAGLSLEQTVAALTLFARSGLRGSDAGTSFRTGLIRLINPTTKAAEVIKKLGLNIRTSSGAIDLTVFQQFADATRDMTAAQRDQALAVIFGQDAIRGAAILAREGTSGLNEQITALKRQGTAAEVAGARMAGLTGAAENLKNQLAALGLTIGSVLVPGLTVVTNGLALFVGVINDTLNQIDALSAKVIGLAKALGDIEFPQISIGPFDTGDIDRFAGRLDSGVANLFRGDSFDAANAELEDIARRMVDVREEAEHFQESGGFIPKRLVTEGKDLRDRLIELGEAITRTGNNNALETLLKKFAAASPQIARAFKDGIITPAEKAELATSHLGAVFLRFVPKDAFIGLGAAVRSGIEDANVRVEEGITNMGAHIRSGIEDASREAVRVAAQMGTNIGDAFKAALSASISGLGGQIAGLERAALNIEIAGGPQEEQRLLRNLEQREVRARKILTKRRSQQRAGDISFEPVREAQEQLNRILDQQDSIRESLRSAAEEKANEIEKARNDADQATLDALAPPTRRLDTRALIAEGTDRLQDDIVVAKAQIDNNKRRIAIINRSFNDKKKAAELISDLKDENIRLNQQIASDTQSMFDAEREAFDVKLGAATAEGNIEKQISLTKSRIAAIDRLIATEKEESKRIKKLREERAQRVNDLEQIQDEQLSVLQSFAQSVLDLTGNKNPLVAVINAQIAEATQDAARAKKGSLAWFKARTEVNNLLKQRKELMQETAEELKSGTTVFDLLTQSVDTFNKSAGSLIDPSQTIVGATGFTADIAGFLRRRSAVGIGAGAIQRSAAAGRRPLEDNVFRGLPRIDKQTQATNSLITAIEKLTKSIDTAAAGGNRSTSEGGLTLAAVNALGARGQAMAEFWKARQARAWEQG